MDSSSSSSSSLLTPAPSCQNISKMFLYSNTILDSPREKTFNIFDYSNTYPLHNPQQNIPDRVELNGIDTRRLTSDLYRMNK